MTQGTDPEQVVLAAPPADLAGYPEAVLAAFPDWVITLEGRSGVSLRATQMNVRYAADGTATVVLPPGVEATSDLADQLNAIANPPSSSRSTKSSSSSG